MRKSISMLVGVVLLAGGIGTYLLAKEEKYANLQVVTNSASFHHHSDIEELEKEAELVVVGKFTGQREFVKIIDGQGIYATTMSKSSVKVQKVLKGHAEQNEIIHVYEDCYIANNELYISTEGYKWMDENGKYLLFLVPGASKNEYVIVGIYEGKFDLTIKNRPTKHDDLKKAFLDPDSEFMGHDFEFENFYKLKEQALKKYGL